MDPQPRQLLLRSITEKRTAQLGQDSSLSSRTKWVFPGESGKDHAHTLPVLSPAYSRLSSLQRRAIRPDKAYIQLYYLGKYRAGTEGTVLVGVRPFGSANALR